MSAELAPELQEKLEELDRELEVSLCLSSILSFWRLAALHSSEHSDTHATGTRAAHQDSASPQHHPKLVLRRPCARHVDPRKRIDVLSWFPLSTCGFGLAFWASNYALAANVSCFYQP